MKNPFAQLVGFTLCLGRLPAAPAPGTFAIFAPRAEKVNSTGGAKRRRLAQ